MDQQKRGGAPGAVLAHVDFPVVQREGDLSAVIEVRPVIRNRHDTIVAAGGCRNLQDWAICALVLRPG